MNPVEQHLWKERVLVITALSPTSIGYKEQNQLLNSGKKGMKDRQLVVYRMYANHWLGPGKIPLTSKEAEAVYEKYEIEKDTFSVVLIGKDGTVKLRKKDIVSTHELFRLIDSMPMRKQEIQRDEKAPER